MQKKNAKQLPRVDPSENDPPEEMRGKVRTPEGANKASRKMIHACGCDALLSVVVVEKAIQTRGAQRLLRLEGIAHTHTHAHTGRQVTLTHRVWVNGPPRGQGRGETAMGREI